MTAQPKLDARKLRADFPIFEQKIHGKPLAYLDSAASSQKPRQVLDTLPHFYETSYANVHRGVYTLAERATAGLRGRAREGARVHQRAAAREVIFTRNATEASTSSPTPGASTTSAPATSSSSPSSSTTRTSFPGSTSRSAPAPTSGRSRSTTTASCSSTRSTRSRGRERQGRREQPRLELARHDQPGRAARRLGARARRDHGRRRGAGRPAPARRRAGSSAATSSPSLAQDVRADERRRALGPRGAARADGAVHSRRPHDPQGQAEETTWGELPYKFEAGTPPIAEAVGLRRRDRLPRRRRDSEAIEEHEHELSSTRSNASPSVPGSSPTGRRPSAAPGSSRSTSKASTRTTSRRSSTPRASRSAPATTAASR